MGAMRVQKFLSMAGVCSRRAAERLISQGRVTVDGKVVPRPGLKVLPGKSVVCVDGKRVEPAGGLVYVALHKPRGVVSTARDPEGRRTVIDLIQGVPQRLYPVGRLDRDSEGLMLLTNDGELTYRLLHPRYKVPKVYRVRVRGVPSREVLRVLRSGTEAGGVRFRPCEIRVLRNLGSSAELEVVLKEGRKRQIRLMFGNAGFPVYRLIRLKMGPISLSGLKPGDWRHLRPREVELLRMATGLFS